MPHLNTVEGIGLGLHRLAARTAREIKTLRQEVEAVQAGAGATDLGAHIASPNPHPAYDTDMQDLSILFENGIA